MTTAYATHRDVFALGLRAEVFAPRARAVASVDPTTGVFRLASHGFDAGLPRCNFYVQGGAVPGVAQPFLPGGLDASTVYAPFAVNGSGNLFQVAPVDGALITSLTNAGRGVFGVEVDLISTLDAIALDESAQIDNALTAHAPPLDRDPLTHLFPQILVGTVARRTARRGRLLLGLANPNYAASFAPFDAAMVDDTKRLAEWIEGRGILPTPVDQTPGVADDGARWARRAAWPPLCGPGWQRGAL